MPRQRDPNFLTGHLCRFCGEPVAGGTILRLLRVDPGQPPYMQKESASHTDCLRGVLHRDVPLTLGRHWNGKRPLLDDSADVFEARRSAGAHSEHSKVGPCAMCAREIAPADLVQRPTATVKAPEFDEQTLPLHADCLAAVSTSKLF